MSQQPYFKYIYHTNRIEFDHWWYAAFNNYKNLQKLAGDSTLTPSPDYGLIYYYYIDNQLKYIGKTEQSLNKRMVRYSYRDTMKVEMLNAYKDGRLSIKTKEIPQWDLDQAEQAEIDTYSQTHDLWNVQYVNKKSYSQHRYKQPQSDAKKFKSYWNSSTPKSVPLLNIKLTFRQYIVGLIIIILSIIMLSSLLNSNTTVYQDTQDSESTAPLSAPQKQQADIEHIAHVLATYRKEHNHLPDYEAITIPYSIGGNDKRRVFAYNDQLLDLYTEANVVNTLKETGQIPAGQSYYSDTIIVDFKQNHPKPQTLNFHILIGYQCQTETIEAYDLNSLKVADSLNFAIIYYTYDSLYKCLDG